MTRTCFTLAAALAPLMLAGAAQAQSTPDYTADLNAMPGRAPAASTPPVSTPPAAATPAASAPPAVASPPRSSVAPAPAQPAPRPAETPPPVAQASPPPSVVPMASPPAAAAPRALTRAEIDALPFSLTLPDGYALTAGRPGPDFQVWTVRKGGVAQLMIYAGPSAQFPIHDGELVEVGSRTTVVVVEEGRRRALEHLFRQSTAPNHVHVWIASVDGADRDRAEAIGHGVSPR